MKTKVLKWNRAEAGAYTTPGYPFLIKGKGTQWSLFHNDIEVFSASSKKECQEDAQRRENETDSSEPVHKTPPRRPGKAAPSTERTTVAESVRNLTTAVDKGKGSESLDEALRSLYLELSQVGAMIGTIGSHAIKIEEELKEINKHLRKYK